MDSSSWIVATETLASMRVSAPQGRGRFGEKMPVKGQGGRSRCR